MRHRHSRPKVTRVIERSKRQIHSRMSLVFNRDVTGLVACSVTFGELPLRPSELVVDDAGLNRKRDTRASSGRYLVAALKSGGDVAVKPYAFTLRHHSRRKLVAEEGKRHVACEHKRLGSRVGAYTVPPAADSHAQIVARAYGGGIVVVECFDIIGHHHVDLRVDGDGKRCDRNGNQRQYAVNPCHASLKVKG